MKALNFLALFFWGSLVVASGFVEPVYAQNAKTYFTADRLFEQQKFEEAYPIFKKLYENDPNTFLFLERATQCLVNLKRYDKAIDFTKEALKNANFKARATIRLGEIYHIKGDTQKAYQIWDDLIASKSQPMQVYISLASAMRDRRDFDQAIELYKKMAKRFPSSDQLTTELADTYMQAGKYEEGIRAYLSLLKKTPDKINYVQTKIFRLRDDRLYDAAILEMNDFIDDLSDNHPSRNILQQLELWLLLERGLEERALATAKRYENENDYPSYLLYSLASRLLAAEEFELAEQAYSYYTDTDNRSLRYQSMEQLAEVYIRWGDFLSDYNLAFAPKRKSLYQKAYSTLTSLMEQAPNYSQMNQVLVTQAELSLNYLHNPKQATLFAQKLQSLNDSSYIAQRSYLQGRIKLYNGDYGRARIDFSRSNKQERIGSLAEKTRYYLALTDFYAGDYEFADIQLNALERQKTSYFANDAVKLRLWIQQGLQADSTGKQIEPFARAVKSYAQGNAQKGFKILAAMIDSSQFHPLKDEALLEMSTFVTPSLIEPVFSRLTQYLDKTATGSPLHERLLWERARIADQIITEPAVKENLTNNEDLPSSTAKLISLYEALLLNYPQGFYASYARNRIQELQQNPS
jgi:tetratricopeptide (TPR) repeat protein